MAFPTHSESGGSVASATSQDVPLGTFSAGDLLIVSVMRRNTNTQTWTLVTDANPSGDTAAFTSLVNTAGSLDRMVVKYRVMVSGDDTKVTITATSGAALAYSVVRVTDRDTGTNPLTGTAVATGGASAYDAPSVDASAWSSADKLFLVPVGCHANDGIAGPSGYSSYTKWGGNPGIRVHYKTGTGTTEDPAEVTGLTTTYYISDTIAIRGASAMSVDAGAVSGTGTAGEASVTMWNYPPAGLAEGTGTAGAPTVTFGAFAPAGAVTGTATSQAATPADATFPTAVTGTGAAGNVGSLSSAPVNAYPDAAEGTGTAGAIVGGQEAYAGAAMGFGGALLVGAGGSTFPPVRGAPLVITVAGTDVSALALVDLTFDATLGSVPTASVTVSDVAETLAWPPATLVELAIGTVETTWFSGPVTSWGRRALFPGWEYTLRAEGWQRNLALSPVYPTTDVTSSYDGPAGTYVSPYPGHYVGMGDGAPVPDVAVIEDVVSSWWTGPALSYDVPYRVSVSWTIRPKGAPLSSVLSEIADRLGYDDVFWIDGEKVLHWRPGYRGGLTQGELRAPIEHIAPFFLAADQSSGGVVPTTLTDAGDSGEVREGVHVVGKWPGANALYVPGPTYGGRDVTSADSEDIYLSTMLAWAYMDGRTEERRTLTATLPPYSPVPPLGTLLGVAYDPIDPVRRYYLVRALRASLAVPGEGAGGIEWTVELGGADRRSYVYEAQAQAEEAAEPPEQQAVALEVGPVSDMALGSVQYVYAWPEDENGNRIRLTSGRVEWTIWRDSVDIGAGDPAVGWWFTETTGITDIVWTEDQPLGFAYIELNCDAPAEPGGDAVVITAQLLVA